MFKDKRSDSIYSVSYRDNRSNHGEPHATKDDKYIKCDYNDDNDYDDDDDDVKDNKHTTSNNYCLDNEQNKGD